MSDPLQDLLPQWRARFPDALAQWSRFTRLREPVWCMNEQEAASEAHRVPLDQMPIEDASRAARAASLKDRGRDARVAAFTAHRRGQQADEDSD